MPHWVEEDGTFIGCHTHRPSDTALVVPEGPEDARQTWNNGQWSARPGKSQEEQDSEVLADNEARAAIVVELYEKLVKEGGPIDPASVDAKASESFEKLKTAINRTEIKGAKE